MHCFTFVFMRCEPVLFGWCAQLFQSPQKSEKSQKGCIFPLVSWSSQSNQSRLNCCTLTIQYLILCFMELAHNICGRGSAEHLFLSFLETHEQNLSLTLFYLKICLKIHWPIKFFSSYFMLHFFQPNIGPRDVKVNETPCWGDRDMRAIRPFGSLMKLTACWGR